MKNSLEYIKKLLKVLIWPIIFMVVTFLVNYIFVAIFNYNNKGNLSNSEFLEYIKTTQYQNELTNYINSKTLIIIILITIILLPIFYKVFKKYKSNNVLKAKDVILPILLGISISLIYNISLFNINNLFPFTNIFTISSSSIVIEIISSGIVGPILEEILFRGIVYNKLKEFNKPMRAIILASVIFAIFHNNIINAIYAFGVSFMFIYLYEKYKTLKAPIIMHMSLNITIILMLRLIVLNYVPFNMYLVLISLVILIIIKKVYIDFDRNG